MPEISCTTHDAGLKFKVKTALVTKNFNAVEIMLKGVGHVLT